ncbi:MAG: hypothetical protein J5I81_14495 [Nitrococcus mobilis]|nr:hypothetical protein [Nitrococcus mobilis]
MEWNQERMSASIERAVDTARRMIREQGNLNGMLATLHPDNDSGFTVFGLAIPEKPEDRELIAEVIRGIADELDAVMVTLAVNTWISMPTDLDSIDLDEPATSSSDHSEVLMVSASHRLLGEATRLENVRREGATVHFDAVTALPGITLEDCFVHILSPQRGPISAAAREQAHQIATGIRLGRVGNGDGQPRH